ncbi:MAG TPA: hypothetical protein VFB16_04690 [Bauldia sp.]|nr:hypothetical protein [Bauldia sp.]
MRPLGLSDTVFYNLGDSFISAMAVLDGPCDLSVLLADLEGVVGMLPALSERPLRIGFWTFARRVRKVDLTRHVAVLRDRTVTTVETAVPYLEKMRRSRISMAVPPWRIFVLNPGEPGQAGSGPSPLSVVFMQIRHGLADAMRGLQVLARMGGQQPTPEHDALARRLPDVDPASLVPEVPIHDVGISVLTVPRREINSEGDSGARFTAVAAAVVGDPELFPHARPLRGNIGRTRLVRRRGTGTALGNHMRMVTVRTQGRENAGRRWRIPGLSHAQDLQLATWLVALAPRKLARLAMRVWYSSFDAVATMIPLPRRLKLGGRAVTGVFGVPPLWGPVPLAMIALTGGDDYHLTIFPGKGFTGSPARLLARLRELFLGAGESVPQLVEPPETDKEARGRPAFAKR